jgi:hypothetical protein
LSSNFNINFKFGGVSSDTYSLETPSFTDGTIATLVIDNSCDEVQVVQYTPLVYNTYGSVSIPIADMYCRKIPPISFFDVSLTIEGLPISWLFVNSTSKLIEGTTKSHGMSYVVRTNISILNSTYYRDVTLNILKWPDSNWISCSSATECTEWHVEYRLTSNVCESSNEEQKELTSVADTMGTTAAVATGVTIAGTIALSSFSSGSSPQMIFTLAGYYQLLSSILLLRYNIPKTLVNLILNFSIFKLDFSFFSYLFPNGDKLLSSGFKETISQQNSRLSSLGYESGSMIDNYFYFFISVIIIILAHVFHNFLYPLLCCSPLYLTRQNAASDDKLSWINNFRVKFYKFFHLGVYISGFFEALLFMYLNCLSEINSFNTKTNLKTASLSFTLLMFALINMVAICLCYRTIFRDFRKEQRSYFHSLYNGINIKNRVHRAYYTPFALRRILMCYGLIFIMIPPLQWSIFVWIQAINLTYSWIHRSMEKLVDNINLIISDIVIVIVSVTVFSMPEITNTDYDVSENEKKGMVLWSVIIASSAFIMIFSIVMEIRSRWENKTKPIKTIPKPFKIDVSKSQVSLQNVQKLSKDGTRTNKHALEEKKYINEEENFCVYMNSPTEMPKKLKKNHNFQ